MKFSVVLPTFNAENSIKKTLSSLKEQIYQNFEVIIIDDGSTDNTSSICKEFVNKDIRFIYEFQSNAGVSKARNRGIELATGDYIAFIDSDDTYQPDYLYEFSKLIENNHDCDNFWCEYKTILPNQSERFFNVGCRFDPVYYTNRKNIMSLHSNNLNAPLWNKVFKIDIITNFNIRMPEHISLGEDLIFNLAYLNYTNNEIAIIRKPLYNYSKLSDESLDTKYRADLKTIYAYIYEQLLFYLKKWRVAEEQMALFYNSVLFYHERVLRNTFHPQSNLSYFEKCKYNKRILKSSKFQEALQKSNCYIHPAYKFAYRIASWHLIEFLNLISSIKKRIKEKS